MRSALNRIVFRRLALWLGGLLEKHSSEISAYTLPRFPGEPKNLRIERPRRIVNPECIHLGDNISLGPGSFIFASTAYPPASWCQAFGVDTQERYTPQITIGDRVSATANLTISATCDVTIESDVMMAGNVNVVDAFHGFSTPDLPYKYQPMERIKPIRIGKGSWLGQNVVILPGVEIGKMCIVGAGSVVRDSIPELSIAVGAPARVIRTWDAVSGEWVAAEHS